MTKDQESAGPALTAEWPFPVSATLGSSVRAAGIERELRARLSFPDRSHFALEDGRFVFRIRASEKARFEIASEILSDALEAIDTLPVLPGEVEDILSISPRERLKWTKDGRLRSAGTRTVKLRGRAKAVTFHVFDPRHIEDLLDRDLPAIWREEDAQAIAEARKRAAGKAALTRAGKGASRPAQRGGRRRGAEAAAPQLEGWDAFAADGLLR
ncbi:hypothetical protein [Antarcticirhabdus aurantiaca]|uniref:Uncharacterized protein n=1 Tax=Antarcticirhabdus aurantiaca TaxID=2606717 RepID=A0ACD4NK11_9HYPH|nr:hypothetical protein [Antarcticirhabdus aurantiaca]WAJ27179.1 hypothetical protein OXU80_20315 [Jeongeuplla avenae]